MRPLKSAGGQCMGSRRGRENCFLLPPPICKDGVLARPQSERLEFLPHNIPGYFPLLFEGKKSLMILDSCCCLMWVRAPVVHPVGTAGSLCAVPAAPCVSGLILVSSGAYVKKYQAVSLWPLWLLPITLLVSQDGLMQTQHGECREPRARLPWR